MSNLPGNPYGTASTVSAETHENDGDWAIAQATMALAYEQRTANLIALMDTSAGRLTLLRDGDEAMDLMANEIKTRLGLGDNND